MAETGGARSTIAPVERTRRRGNLTWDPEAVLERDKIINRTTQELNSEAGRIARLRDSTVVTVRYVQRASGNLPTGPRSTGVADVLLAIGILLLGSAIGVGCSYATADHRTNFAGWLIATTGIAAVVGALLVGIGVTSKLKSR